MKTYAEAAAFLGGRDSRTIPSIRSTSVERLSESGNIGLRYHGTYVVVYRANGTYVLRSGGWRTNTTKSRINDFSPARVYQRNFQWYIMVRCETKPWPFHDGIVIDGSGKPVTHDESAADSGGEEKC